MNKFSLNSNALKVLSLNSLFPYTKGTLCFQFFPVIFIYNEIEQVKINPTCLTNYFIIGEWGPVHSSSIRGYIHLKTEGEEVD